MAYALSEKNVFFNHTLGGRKMNSSYSQFVSFFVKAQRYFRFYNYLNMVMKPDDILKKQIWKVGLF